MKIKWLQITEECFAGVTQEYKIFIDRQNHGGWAYKLFFERGYTKLILAQQGYVANYIESLHAAKYISLKKLNFFYAQQNKITCK